MEKGASFTDVTIIQIVNLQKTCNSPYNWYNMRVRRETDIHSALRDIFSQNKTRRNSCMPLQTIVSTSICAAVEQYVERISARVILRGAKRNRTFSSEIPNDAVHRLILVTLGFRLRSGRHRRKSAKQREGGISNKKQRNNALSVALSGSGGP